MKSLSKLISILSFITLSSSLFAQNTVVEQKLTELEASTKGRIGVYAINTANNAVIHYRADEHFPTGCTSKVIGVAAVLHKSMSDPSLLSQNISYSKKDLTNWDPITEKHVDSGMTVEELSAAAISYSDNAAMNLLLKKIGGLDQMNVFARIIGNNSFQQNNGWPEEAFSGGKGDVKDSSTPKDMALSLEKLVFTDVLAKPQREKLISWLKATTTGSNRIRAGLPKDFVVADKTGTGSAFGSTNDIAVIWPPHCAPIILAVYYTNDDSKAVKREDIVATVTRLVIDNFASTDSCIKQSI